MPKLLTPEAVAQFNRDGYYFPVKILNDEQVAENRISIADAKT